MNIKNFKQSIFLFSFLLIAAPTQAKSLTLTPAPSIGYGGTIAFGSTNTDIGHDAISDSSGMLWAAGEYSGNLGFTSLLNNPLPQSSSQSGYINLYASGYLGTLKIGGTTGWGTRITSIDKRNSATVYAGVFWRNTGTVTTGIDFNPFSVTYDPAYGGSPDFRTTLGARDYFITYLGTNYWTLTIGSAGSGQNVNDVKLDSQGNVFIIGSYSGTVDFDPGPGTANSTSGYSGQGDPFIASYDSNGNFRWVKVISTTPPALGDLGSGNRLVIDSNDNIIVTGALVPAFINNIPGYGPYSNPSQGTVAFVAKLDNLGNYLWLTSLRHQPNFPTTSNYPSSIGMDVAVDQYNNIYAAGKFSGTADFNPSAANFFMTAPINLNFNYAGSDGHILKLNPQGQFVWAKQIGATISEESISAVTTTINNRIEIAGSFGGTTDFDPGPGVTILTGAWNSFVNILDSNGNYLTTAVYGPNHSLFPETILKIGTGMTVLTGGFVGTGDFDPTPGISNFTATTTPFPNGTPDAYINILLTP